MNFRQFRGDVVVSSNITFSKYDMEKKGRFLLATGCTAFALPTPTQQMKASITRFRVVNNTASSVAGSCTNGFAQGGDSITIGSGAAVDFEIHEDGAGGYIYDVVNGGGAASIDAEAIRAIVAAFVAAGTHTNVVVTHDDPGNALSFTVDGGLTQEQVEDIVGAMVAGNTETGLTVTYDDATGKYNFAVVFGTGAGTACQGDDNRLPTVDEIAAINGAAAPSGANVFATMADIPASELTADELAGIQGAVTPVTALNPVATTADLPADELTADELAAVNGAAAPTALNVFATIADVPVKATGAEVDTGTDDAKFVTAKAVADSSVAMTSDIPVKASGAEINAGTDDAKFVTAKAITDSELGALLNSLNYQDYAPTLGTFPGVVDSTVARYQRVGNSCSGYVDLRGSDGDGVVPASITLPVAPVDGNCRVPCKAYQKIGAGAKTDMLAEIDAETSLKIIFNGAVALTDATAWQVQVHFGPYEVAAS